MNTDKDNVRLNWLVNRKFLRGTSGRRPWRSEV